MMIGKLVKSAGKELLIVYCAFLVFLIAYVIGNSHQRDTLSLLALAVAFVFAAYAGFASKRLGGGVGDSVLSGIAAALVCVASLLVAGLAIAVWSGTLSGWLDARLLVPSLVLLAMGAVAGVCGWLIFGLLGKKAAKS
jgi:hypothetical protein